MFVKHFLTSHDRDTTSIIYQCTKMNMSKNVVIPVILFVFVICICNPKVLANEEGYKFGEKLPITPFVVLEKLGLQMSFLECEAYSACLSINYNRKDFVCELNSRWKYIFFPYSYFLINDSDYVFREVHHPVSFFYSVCFQRPKIKSDYWKHRLRKQMHNLASYFDTNTLNCKINYHLQWDQKLCIFLVKRCQWKESGSSLLPLRCIITWYALISYMYSGL